MKNFERKFLCVYSRNIAVHDKRDILIIVIIIIIIILFNKGTEYL
jgi:hypothetical protein